MEFVWYQDLPAFESKDPASDTYTDSTGKTLTWTTFERLVGIELASSGVKESYLDTDPDADLSEELLGLEEFFKRLQGWQLGKSLDEILIEQLPK